MMDMLITIFVIVGFVAFLLYLWFRICTYRVFVDAKLVIEEYRGRCHEANRFIFNEGELKKLYPEATDNVLREVWRRLVMEKAIDRDNVDGEWCIKK